MIAIGVIMLIASFYFSWSSWKSANSFAEKDHTLIAVKILFLLFMIGIGTYLTGKEWN
ncbi:MAG: hypothetical protein J7J16_06210 [Deltaproteobacteria bacterium]|nr:hypothetical protein [Deltaproteobacteria bacterium]